MTIDQVLAQADRLYDNPVEKSVKREWLAQLDGQLRLELVELHQPGPELGTGADRAESGEDTLLFGVPWQEMYLNWLYAKIDLVLGEIGRYNNHTALFNSERAALAASYKARHRPVERGQFVY